MRAYFIASPSGHVRSPAGRGTPDYGTRTLPGARGIRLDPQPGPGKLAPKRNSPEAPGQAEPEARGGTVRLSEAFFCNDPPGVKNEASGTWTGARSLSGLMRVQGAAARAALSSAISIPPENRDVNHRGSALLTA